MKTVGQGFSRGCTPMPIQRYSRAAVLLSFGLFALLALWQTAGAAPQEKAETKKAEKAKPADKDMAKEEAKKDDAKKDDAKKDDKAEKKEEAKKAEAEKAVVVQVQAVAPVPAAAPAGAAVPAPPGAPVKQPGAETEITEGITLPTDRQIKMRLQMAREDLIKHQQWGEAARILQSVLNNKQDVFVPERAKGKDGQERVHWLGARHQANKLLSTIPSNGLQFYEVQYGGEAKKILSDAKKSGDPQLLAQVAERYAFTEAGAEAIDLLGTYHLDRGQPLMAARCFSSLLHRSADQLSPLALFKATLAFRMCGDPAYAQAAKDAWKQLGEKVRTDGLQVGDDTITLEQLQKELDRASPSNAGISFGWTVFRGNATRSATTHGSAPFLDKRWQKSNLDAKQGLAEEGINPNTRALIEETLRQQQYRPETVLPAFFPIATGGKLIFRNYWSVYAVNIKSGETEWYSTTTAALDNLLSDPNRKTDIGQWMQLYKQMSSQNIIFENTMIGTLSTDNIRAYAVDDLAVPPHPTVTQGNPWGGWGNGTGLSAAMSDLANRSQLVAIDLETGKLVWQHGDPQHDQTDLAGCYFLGAPLPLGGRLYVLIEKNAELRLVCLDPSEGKILWSQTLATARDKLLSDVRRRLNAVNLAYAEGILVCPTNAGAVLGVDLQARSLAWAYPYREKPKDPKENNQNRIGRGGFVVWGGADPNANIHITSEWKLSSPIIQDGKVVFTAPDGSAIHCIGLQNGELLWQADRRDDLYLAGVFNGKVMLVGKNSARALALADGKQVWQVNTGLPSGQGVASGSSYYLPLKKGEVCKIDLDRGVVVANSPAPKNERLEPEIPGNLLFYEGDVISQNETTVTCYPQVESEVVEVDNFLKRNPADPVALTKRGELRLYKGDLPGAVADLMEAVKNNPPADKLPKTKAKLYATLTELLKQHFNDGEQYLPVYRELCKVAMAPTATAEERQKADEENRRRQAGYLCLLAKGREDQGRLVDAFQAYLDFGALSEGKELVPVINEPGVQAQPDVWARGRITALVAKATPEQRKPLEQEIARRWQTVQASKDHEALPRFVAAFGSLFGPGREARLHLAERLLEEKSYLEAELQLLQLVGQREDPRVAGRAVEALARLMTRKGLLEDAAYYYRILARDFAAVPIRDGKTGADLFNELTTDKRFLPFIDEMASPFLGASVKVFELSGGVPYPQIPYAYEPKGEMLPFFQRHRLTWSTSNKNQMNSYELRLLDRDTEEVRWSVTAPATRAAYTHYNTNNLRFPIYTKGHLVIAYVGHVVYALDPVAKKKLWDRDLLSLDRVDMSQPYQQYALTVDKEGALHLFNPMGTNDGLGQIGPVTASFVCLRTPDGLVALDPVKGNVLWTKTDLAQQTHLFGDDQYIYLIEVRDGNQVSAARAIRGQDGASVEVPDFADAYRHRQRVLGGRLFVAENEPAGGLVLRFYDVRTGKDLWKKSVPPNSLVLRTDEPDLAAVVERNGKLTVVDLRSQQEVFHATIKPEHVDGVKDGWLLRDARSYYAVLNRPAQNFNANPQGPFFAMPGPFTNATSLRTEPVNGMVYSFHRSTGRLGWYYKVENQMILLEQFQDLPVVLFSARYHEVAQGQQPMVTPVSHTMSIEKRTGKLIWNRKAYSQDPQAQGQFFSLVIDRQAGSIDLVSNNLRLRHQVVGGGTRESVDAGSTGGGQLTTPRPVADGRRQPVDLRIAPPVAADR
jgi:outer membrane protein assembly factor BamB